ncbi:MAG TPA: TspO/MBR family protein [Candidatus Saccharimonadales bacterium]|nr:TspO/MBR family protein [Candidatus Saccharimonadales bacterium]
MLKKVTVFILSIGLSFAAGAIGSLATIPNIPSWYANLEKPAFNPPNWIFGPVWSVLYVLMGIALALIILQAVKRPKQTAYFWFGLQLVLNTVWSLVFFGLHSPWLGIAVIIALIISIVMTILEFNKIKKAAAWLLSPYLAWVCFATYLTTAIALLN